jgi:hypothetical protein
MIEALSMVQSVPIATSKALEPFINLAQPAVPVATAVTDQVFCLAIAPDAAAVAYCLLPAAAAAASAAVAAAVCSWLFLAAADGCRGHRRCCGSCCCCWLLLAAGCCWWLPPPLRNKKAKPTDESSGPSPLDGLDKLGPAPSGK